MKKLLTLTCLYLTISTIQAQTCNDYFPLTDGTRWVLETFNHKNKFQTKSVQHVTDTKNTTDGYAGRMIGEIFDNKDKSIGKLDYDLKCAGDNFYVSMNSMLSNEQMEAYADMDVSVDGDFLELPANMSAGMDLKDAAIEVRVKNSGIPIMTINMDVYERKVEGFESVTTPAGTFECVKISFRARTKMGKAIPIKVEVSGTEWYAKGTGLVRSESYDKKNKLTGYTVLTEYSE